jgi:hypothetical protein
MRRRLVAVLSMLLLAVPAAVVIGAPAAQAASPPGACEYFYSDPYYGETCFEWEGDDQWVWDGAPNGWGVVVQIETDYGKVRWCANREGASTWVECKFDHDEDHCVRFRLFEQDDGADGPTRNLTAWSQYISIRTGSNC